MPTRKRGSWTDGANSNSVEVGWWLISSRLAYNVKTNWRVRHEKIGKRHKLTRKTKTQRNKKNNEKQKKTRKARKHWNTYTLTTQDSKERNVVSLLELFSSVTHDEVYEVLITHYNKFECFLTLLSLLLCTNIWIRMRKSGQAVYSDAVKLHWYPPIGLLSIRSVA